MYYQDSDAEDNADLIAATCSKEHFVEIVLILADFYCIVHERSTDPYPDICNTVATDMARIFNLSLHPYTTFEAFRQAYQQKNDMLTRQFAGILRNLQDTPFQIQDQSQQECSLNFDNIVDDIENRILAEYLSDLLIPLLAKK